jgi:hypothetical protein
MSQWSLIGRHEQRVEILARSVNPFDHESFVILNYYYCLKSDVTELPSATGATRRTNHICSIKGCHNLLAPHIPWKMCDICREHDRENRKNKKLRDSGQLPPLRFQTNIGTLKKGGKLKNFSSKETVDASAGISQGGSSLNGPVAPTLTEDAATAHSSARTSSSNDADEVLTDLLFPDGSGPAYNVSCHRRVISPVLIIYYTI